VYYNGYYNYSGSNLGLMDLNNLDIAFFLKECIKYNREDAVEMMNDGFLNVSTCLSKLDHLVKLT